MATYTPNLTFTSGEYASSGKINDLINNMLAIFPVGSLLYIAQAPTTTETTYLGKWLQCNGALVSTTTYASLFAVVGTSYGSGSGTFGLPDLRGRLPVAIASSGHADVNAFGDNDGAALASRRLKHAHTFANAAHTHTWSATLSNDGGHTHSYNATYATVTNVSSGGTSGNVLSLSTGGFATGSGSGSHSHTYTPSSVASATAVSTIGIAGTTTDQPGYVCAGCWYIAYA